MKKLMYGMLLGSFAMMYACQPKSSETPESSVVASLSDPTTLETMYAVPLDTAIVNIKRFLENAQVYDSLVAAALGKKDIPQTPIQSFTVHSEDLLEVMGLPLSDTSRITFKYVRMYLGMNESNEFKLYLTPVVGADLNAVPPIAGRDTVLSGDFQGVGDIGNYVLDFTSPCPKTCPGGTLLDLQQ